MALAKEWTDGKDPGAKKDFEKYILNSGQLLDKLDEMLKKRIEEVNRSEENDDFTSPSWALQCAARQARRKAFNEIRRLLDRGN